MCAGFAASAFADTAKKTTPTATHSKAKTATAAKSASSTKSTGVAKSTSASKPGVKATTSAKSASSTKGSGTSAGKGLSPASAKTGRTNSKRGHYVAARRPSYQTAPTPDRYQQIQQSLADRGFYKGEVNGVWGTDSQDAMKRFQESQNLPDDGKITSKALIGLGLGPTHGTQPDTPPPGATQPGAAAPPTSGPSQASPAQPTASPNPPPASPASNPPQPAPPSVTTLR